MLTLATRTPPTNSSPVSLVDVKAHLNITWSNDDTRLTELIYSAIDLIERETARCLVPTTWNEYLPGFYPHWHYSILNPPLVTPYVGGPGYYPWQFMRTKIFLTKSPVSVVNSITYYDGTNTSATWATSAYYAMLGSQIPAWIEPVTNYPPTYLRPDAVCINYTCPGITSGQSPYDAVQHCVKLLVGTWNEIRQDEQPGSLTQLCHGADRLIDIIKAPSYC
jgi:hypothetical protein